MVSTTEWATALGHSSEDVPPAIVGYAEPYPRIGYDIGVRAIILQGVVAVGCDVDPEPIIDWFHEQKIWEAVSPKERAFLSNPTPSMQERVQCRWRQESEWTLLWMISKVEALGLPTHQCDTRRLVDEIIPPLGSDIEDFLTAAHLRPPDVLLAEDLRTYDLWCALARARRKNGPIPADLNIDVLYERRYAFE